MLKKLVALLGSAIAWLYVPLVVLTLLEVGLRYLFNSPTLWSYSSIVFLSGFTMLYAGVYAYSRGEVVKVASVTSLLPHKVQKILLCVSELIGLIYLLAIFYASYVFAKFSIIDPSGNFKLETTGSSIFLPFPGILKISMVLVLGLFISCVFITALLRVKDLFR